MFYTNRWLHGRDQIEVMGVPGIDEGTLALTIDAYSTTGRSQAYLVSATGEPVVTRRGLRILPDRQRMTDSDAPLMIAADLAPVMALDAALDAIMHRYGRATAKGIALAFEYPDFLRRTHRAPCPTHPQRVTLYCSPTIVLDLTGPLHALHTANQCRPLTEGRLRYEIAVASEHGGLVATSAGL